MTKKKADEEAKALVPCDEGKGPALSPLMLTLEELGEFGPDAVERLKDHPKKRMVLAAITRWPSVQKAAEISGTSAISVYAWLGRLKDQRRYDEVFARCFDICWEQGVAHLEKIAQERAVGGSDKLLMFLLRAYKRDVFGDVDMDPADVHRKPVNVSITLHPPGEKR